MHDVEILVAHKTLCGADWRWENNAGDADYVNLWCVTEGKGTLTLNGEQHSLHVGDCFVIRMWDYCLGEHDPEHPLTVLWALYRYRGIQGKPAENQLPKLYRYIGNLAFFSQLFERAITAFNADGETHHYAEDWMRTTLIALAEEDQQANMDAIDQVTVNRIQQLCTRIQAAPGQPVSVADLADEWNYTPGHFTRIFRHCTGLTPRDFITQTRIDAAKSLLCLSNYSISRIAELLGYRDVFYFSRQFHQRVGMSPSAFRRR